MAIIADDVRLGTGAVVEAHAVVEDGAVIGKAVRIGANVFIGHHAKIGNMSHIYPNVVIREHVQIGQRVIIHSGTVIGSDGFGYEIIDGKHVKIPHVGSVLIEDDVEIGANTCVDRGRFKNTIIRKGTKIDNLVQIAHNVVIGENCVVVSQVGISGSTELGKNVVVAGQAGIVGHVSVGDEAVICARSGVSKTVPTKAVVLGEPAKPIQEQKKIFALIARLPEMFKDLSDLKKKRL
jgi:UDP-3-O-[3-hydroxymyristoyl] glucosamine N-acyltransferase